MVQSTSYSDSNYPASSVLILGEEDELMDNVKYNYWLAEEGKTTGQGFTVKVDYCARWVAGCQIKNKGKGANPNWATKAFKIYGAKNESGPWKTLLEEELIDTTRGQPASLLNFTFKEPAKVQFLKFDLLSYWGPHGGGLQYFAAIPATSKQHQTSIHDQNSFYKKTKRWIWS